MRFKKLALQAVALIFEYETAKIVSIRSKKIGLLCRFIQLLIIAFIIGFLIHKQLSLNYIYYKVCNDL